MNAANKEPAIMTAASRIPRSHVVLARLLAFLGAGKVLHFEADGLAWTAGRAARAVGPASWEMNSYGPGAHGLDDAFWGVAHLARELVWRFGKRTMWAALEARDARLTA